jgi:hypothetical protein
MEGIAYIKAFTTIRIPCHREIALNGRNARNVRKDLRTFKFSFSSISNENTETLRVELNEGKRKKFFTDKMRESFDDANGTK